MKTPPTSHIAPVSEIRSSSRAVDAALARARAFIEDRRMASIKGPHAFAVFERELHRRLMEVERETIGEAIAAADVDAPEVLINGVVHRRVLRSAQTYMTAAGPVEVERTLYKDRRDPKNRSVSIADLQLGIIEGTWTPLAAQQAVYVVAQMTPQKGEELFERMGNMTPSKSSLDRLPKRISERWEERREEFEELVRDQGVIPNGTVTVAVSLDGVHAPFDSTGVIEKRAAAAAEGRVAQGPIGYREVGCGTLSFCDKNGDMLAAVRLARAPEPKKATLKKSLHVEVLSVLHQEPKLRLVKLADGALDNWTFLADELPEGVEIVDFFHAAEHLCDALGGAYGDGTVEARQRGHELRHVLLEDLKGVSKIIRSLRYLAKKHPRATRVTEAIGYFTRHQDRMRYAEYRAQGLPIGSGVVEAACKTLVAQRLKQSGMRWSQEGAQAILTIRAWDQSADRFDQAWALVAATYEAEVTVVHNAVPFTPPLPTRPRNLAEQRAG